MRFNEIEIRLVAKPISLFALQLFIAEVFLQFFTLFLLMEKQLFLKLLKTIIYWSKESENKKRY